MGGANHVLEHHQEEGGVVEGRQELDEEHGEGVGEEEEEGEKDEQGDGRLVACLSHSWTDGIDTLHCPGI